MDYRMLGMMHERVPRDVDCGRVAAAAGWDMDWIQRSIVGEAIEQWRDRLRSCARAKGGHFEHFL